MLCTEEAKECGFNVDDVLEEKGVKAPGGENSKTMASDESTLPTQSAEEVATPRVTECVEEATTGESVDSVSAQEPEESTPEEETAVADAPSQDPVQSSDEMNTAVAKSSSAEIRDDKLQAAPKKKAVSKVGGFKKSLFRNRFANKKALVTKTFGTETTAHATEAPAETAEQPLPPIASFEETKEASPKEASASDVSCPREEPESPAPHPIVSTSEEEPAPKPGPVRLTSVTPKKKKKKLFGGKMASWKLLRSQKKRNAAILAELETPASKDAAFSNPAASNDQDGQFLTVDAVSDETLSLDEPELEQEDSEDVAKAATDDSFEEAPLPRISEADDASTANNQVKEELQADSESIKPEPVKSPSKGSSRKEQESRSLRTAERPRRTVSSPKRLEEDELSLDVDTFDDDLSNTFAPAVPVNKPRKYLW